MNFLVQSFIRDDQVKALFLLVLALIMVLLGLRLPTSAVAPTLAALTALLIAFVAYPWQKSRDRMLQLQFEKRTAYKELLSQSSELFKVTGEHTEREFFIESVKFRNSLMSLSLYADENVLEKFLDLFTALEYLDDILRKAKGIGSKVTTSQCFKADEAYKNAEEAAMEVARADSLGISIEEARSAISKTRKTVALSEDEDGNVHVVQDD